MRRYCDWARTTHDKNNARSAVAFGEGGYGANGSLKGSDSTA